MNARLSLKICLWLQITTSAYDWRWLSQAKSIVNCIFLYYFLLNKSILINHNSNSNNNHYNIHVQEEKNNNLSIPYHAFVQKQNICELEEPEA